MDQTLRQGARPGQPGFTLLMEAAALCAGALYFLDRQRGRRRRAWAADKLRHLAARSGTAAGAAVRDLGNRARGLRVRAGRLFAAPQPAVDDSVLVARVRQKLGRAVLHPRAINVVAHGGEVTLTGLVHAHEKERLLNAVRHVVGVVGVSDLLDTYEMQDGAIEVHPQDAQRRSAHENEWKPGTRALMLLGGGALGAWGLRRRDAVGGVMALAGTGLVARSASNRTLGELTGLGAAGRPIVLHKAIHIEAAPETVFDTWSRFEDMPRFMSHVREVRRLSDDWTHWVVEGPAGMRLEWNARVTESRRPHALAWQSEPQAPVQSSGHIHFEPAGKGTRVSVQLAYLPPGGALGHAFAALLGKDPKQQMDDDLLRMKQAIETGREPHDAGMHRHHGGAGGSAGNDGAGASWLH